MMNPLAVRLLAATMMLCLMPVASHAQQPANAAKPANAIEVNVTNHSTPEVCAERDNVQIDFAHPQIGGLHIQAVHPVYIATIAADRYAPDYTSCTMAQGARFAEGAERVTIWETPDMWITGYRMREFWRPGTVPLRVGNRVEQGFHLVQFWMRYRDRAEEVLVLYPPDGYWRLRPLPYEDMRLTAYGSSFLVGPIEVAERPIVALRDIAFDPATRSFAVNFARGGSAKISLAAIDQDHADLKITFDGAMPNDRPFASLRSMYSTETNSDAARIAWRDGAKTHWVEAPVMDFNSTKASEIWIGRHLPSRHNLSAPDMIFGQFKQRPAQ